MTTGHNLAQAFFDLRKGAPRPKAQPHEIALLYGHDEVRVLPQKGEVILPDRGRVKWPNVRDAGPDGWYAVSTNPDGTLSFAIGSGDPYVTGPNNPLPVAAGGVCHAFPFAMLREMTAGKSS